MSMSMTTSMSSEYLPYGLLYNPYAFWSRFGFRFSSIVRYGNLEIKILFGSGNMGRRPTRRGPYAPVPPVDPNRAGSARTLQKSKDLNSARRYILAGHTRQRHIPAGERHDKGNERHAPGRHGGAAVPPGIRAARHKECRGRLTRPAAPFNASGMPHVHAAATCGNEIDGRGGA